MININLANTEPYNFRWRFFRLALINIASNLMVPLSGLIGIGFLGHLEEIRHLSGVAIATILFNYLYQSLAFLRMGVTGKTAQAVGRDDREAVLLTGLRSGILALGLGIAILILQYPIRIFGFTLLSAALDVKVSGQAYYNARIWAAPATLLNFVLIGWFLGREQSGKVLLMSLVGNAANILLDYLLIIRCGWSSTGAGLATAVSQYAMLLVGLIFICFQVQWKEVRAISGQIFAPSALQDTVALNLNVFIRSVALLTAFSIFTNLSSAMEMNFLAENTLLLQVVALGIYAIDGMAFATETLTGIFHGENAKDRLKSLLAIAGISSSIIGLALAFVFILFPMPLFGIMTNHTEVIEDINYYVIWLLPVLGFGSIAFVLDGYFLGLAEASRLRNAALTATLIGFIPMAIAAWQFRSNSLLWLALSLFMVVRVIVLGIQIPRTLKS